MGPIGAAGRCVAWGEVLWDLFPDQRRLGGAPANVAHHLAALGAEVALVSRVGDDEPGRAAVAALAAAGVDVETVQVDPSRATGAVGVELVAGEARYRFHPDCAWEHIEWDDRARARVTGARAICFGTLSQRRPEARAALDAALAAARATAAAAGTRFLAVCDLNLRPADQDVALVRWALGAADVVKLNQREEAALGRMFGQRDAVAWLLGEIGAAAVAVSRGEGGCRLVAGARGFAAGPRDVEQAGFPAEAGGDTVGCGDALTAVLTIGLLAGAPLARVAEAGCRYAAFVAGQRGAMPPVPVDLAAEVRAGLAADLPSIVSGDRRG
ncbi:MAG TPA: PfkB family carbohydrate kinase [Kofleriaceae bacterium]|nr:PfkB family carbohydrate kinase [Kofleriaceae bacterium]